MGIEFVLLVLLAILGVGAFFFFSGSFGAAKAAKGDGENDGGRPSHAYVENETEARSFGADSTDSVRRRAEQDPDTEVRA